MGTLSILKNSASNRYEAHVGEQIASIANFVDEGDRRLFPHTTTFRGFGGQGIATALVEHALRETIAEEKQIVPLCSFVRAVAMNPEFAEHVVAR